MILADLAVAGISELATPEGRTARTGADLGRIRSVRDAAVACRAGEIVFVGTDRDFRQAVTMEPGGRVLDARGGTVLPGFVDAHIHTHSHPDASHDAHGLAHRRSMVVTHSMRL